ncbi:MAG: hypothetical protein U9O56_07890 [Campylobacterota bacterium]|nr:hypothetical protein [Campylobacterota bacterium]
MAIKGITTKTMKDGSKAIMVRFKYQGRAYPVKNFTKLYGIKTQKEAEKNYLRLKSSLVRVKIHLLNKLIPLTTYLMKEKKL